MSNYFCISPKRFITLGDLERKSLTNYFHTHFYGVHYEKSGCWPLVKGYAGNLPFKIPRTRKGIYNIARHIDTSIPAHPFFYIRILPVDEKQRLSVFMQPDFFAIAAVFGVFGGANAFKGFNWRMNYSYGVFWRSPRPLPEDPQVTLLLA